MKIVLTGVTKGLGRGLAGWFASHGHTVAGCGRDVRKIADLRLSHPAPHRFDSVDVSRSAEVGRWAEQVLGSMGAPDFLINNAGLMNTAAPLWQVPTEEFAAIVSVNIVGVANMIRAFVPAMVERKTGVIVNLSSGWGQSVSAGVAPYCMTKWAIEGLTKALAEDLPPGMAAIPLSPGVVDTSLLRQAMSPERAATYPKPDVWAETAGPFILALGPEDNGKSLRAHA